MHEEEKPLLSSEFQSFIVIFETALKCLKISFKVGLVKRNRTEFDGNPGKKEIS
jgi:hypothetical protein